MLTRARIVRYHVVQEFNKGVYDYIVATDESGGRGEEDELAEGEDGEDGEDASVEVIHGDAEGEEEKAVSEAESDIADTKDNNGELSWRPCVVHMLILIAEPSSSKKRKRPSPLPTAPSKRIKEAPSEHTAPAKGKKKAKGDREYGVTRGVDFIDVACVLNFDLPSSSRAYTHRVGRTARAGRSGMALSFVLPKVDDPVVRSEAQLTVLRMSSGRTRSSAACSPRSTTSGCSRGSRPRRPRVGAL
jgi:ATP-dependent RNA helicase DDX56/DBP9